MELKEIYTSFSPLYRNRMDSMVQNPKNRFHDAIQYLINEGIDVYSRIWKKAIDSEEEVTINGIKYTLLPLEITNINIPTWCVDDSVTPSWEPRFQTFSNILSNPPYFMQVPYEITSYVVGDDLEINPSSPIYASIRHSYIEHYKATLGENWGETDFNDRLEQLKYLTVKYAKNNETGEVFAVGFFGANTYPGPGGECLTNAELYVLPEFRKMGIAKKLVYLSFEVAKQDGITNFDSLTYRVDNANPLGFWENIGATVSGLYHISGDISTIQSKISESMNKKTYN